MKRRIFMLIIIGVIITAFWGCSLKIIRTRTEILPPDYRYQQLPVVRKYEALKQQSVFKNTFEKKGEVCPLCQF